MLFAIHKTAVSFTKNAETSGINQDNPPMHNSSKMPLRQQSYNRQRKA